MLKVSTREVNGVWIIDLSGKITIGKGDLILREAIDQSLKDDHSTILLSLSDVGYMDSAGIGELVACYKRVLERKGQMKLVNPAGRAKDLLALTKLDEYFDTFQTEEEALATF
jgi:anti-sigma B factor antagonist